MTGRISEDVQHENRVEHGGYNSCPITRRVLTFDHPAFDCLAASLPKWNDAGSITNLEQPVHKKEERPGDRSIIVPQLDLFFDASTFNVQLVDPKTQMIDRLSINHHEQRDSR